MGYSERAAQNCGNRDDVRCFVVSLVHICGWFFNFPLVWIAYRICFRLEPEQCSNHTGEATWKFGSRCFLVGFLIPGRLLIAFKQCGGGLEFLMRALLGGGKKTAAGCQLKSPVLCMLGFDFLSNPSFAPWFCDFHRLQRRLTEWIACALLLPR